MEFNWLDIAKRLEAIAQAGLTYTDNMYDRERYEELRDIGHYIFHQYTGTPLEVIHELFSGEHGYPTPKVDIRGVVFRGDKVLLIQEKSDALWALPGGWADIGYTPGEIAAKEVKEEAGLEVRPVRLLAVLDKNCHGHPPSPVHVYKLFILCQENGGEPKPGMETMDADFFELNDLPVLSTERNTVEQISMMFNMKNDPDAPALMD